MSERTDRVTEAFAALNSGDPSRFLELFVEGAQWLGVPGSGLDGATPVWRNRAEVVDLLHQRHREGRRFEPSEFIEEGLRVAVGLTVSDVRTPSEPAQVYKVFVFQDDRKALLYQDCIDREDALAYLKSG